MKRRLLSLLLVIVMVLGMFPTVVMAEEASGNSDSVSIEDFQFSALTNKAQDYLDEIALTLAKDDDGEYVLYIPGEGVSAYVNSKEVTLQIAAPEGYQETFSVDYTKYAGYADPEGSLETVISDKGIVKLNEYASGAEGDTTLNFSEEITVYFTETQESCNIKLVPYCNLKSLSVSIGSTYRPVGQKDATTFYATVVKGTTVNITSQATIKDNSTGGINSTVTIDGQKAETITYTPENDPGDVKNFTIKIEDELRGLLTGTYTLELKTIEADLYPVVEFDNSRLTVNAGETVELSVNATNLHGTTTYRWQAGIPANHFDVNSDTITLDTSKAANYAMTRCTVSNIVDGLTYSTATKPKTVTVQSDSTAQPKILTQPVAAEYVSGLEAQPLSVVAKGTVGGKLSYQWYSNTENSSTGGTAIANATAADYVPDTSAVGTTYYYCEVVDTVNRTASAPMATECVEVKVLSNELSMDGEGTEGSPFMIEDAGDLAEIRDFVDKGYTFKNDYFEFANNIDLPQDWDPIGSNPTPNPYDTGKGMYIRPFSGTLNGGGFTVTVAEDGLPLFDYVREATIKNLNIYGKKIAGYGLINEYDVDYGTDGDYSTGDPATPHTVTIENCTIKSGTSIKYSGFIGGYASGLNIVYINNCTVEEDVVVGYGVQDGAEDANTTSVGSLAGEFNGYVTNCTSAATVYARGNGGGLIGVKGQSMGPCQVVNSSFTGKIESQRNAGGIIGNGYNCDNTPIVTIKNCYVSADITGSKYIGGILGAEPGCVQCWSNGTGGVMDNVFVGTLTASGSDAYVGGIIGYMLSINSGNTIRNNYYQAGNVDKGIGFIQYVDTSAEHETASGAIYFDSSVALPDVRGIAKPNYNRNDDPLGKDADKLAKMVTAEQLRDGTVAALLNSSDTSLHNWITDTEKGHPVQSTEPIAYKLEVSGEYKTEYTIGDELDLTGAAFAVTWTDGKTTTPAFGELTVSGYDKNTRGKQTVKLTYGAASAEIEVTVLLSSSAEITVTFALLGDTVHGEPTAETGTHTLADDNLETWIEETSYRVGVNATVLDLVTEALSENEMTFANSDGNYIESITRNDIELAEFTNGINSGWMYTINGVHSDKGVAEQYMENGDVIIFHYTDDYTVEYENEGSASNPGEGTVITSEELQNAYKETGEKLASQTPDTGSTEGEWLVLGLARANYGISDEFKQAYLNAAKAYINENYNNGKLHENKSTENSRLILALTALGEDPAAFVSGKNLLTGLADFDWVKGQGINGPIWALIALDSQDYTIPSSSYANKTTRDLLISTILEAQLNNGGWATSGTKADTDMTAMAIQALAPYYNTDNAVKTAVDSAVTLLSKTQDNATGAYEEYTGTLNAESTAQVIVALTSLGIDPGTDPRFISVNGFSVLDGLMKFYKGDGKFAHIANGVSNQMATEQSYYALVSYYRLLNNDNTLYDMSDLQNQYEITIDCGDHGSVSAPAKAAAGVEITITVTPDTGYELDTLKVNNVTQTVDSSGQVKFTMPEADVIITAAFKESDNIVSEIADAMDELRLSSTSASEEDYEAMMEVKNAYNGLTAAQKRELQSEYSNAFDRYEKELAEFEEAMEKQLDKWQEKLDKAFEKLDEEDYSEDNWETIEDLYDDAKDALEDAKHAGEMEAICDQFKTDVDEIETGADMEVTFRLIGDFQHDDADEHETYVTWVETTEYTLEAGATVYDLFVEAMSDAGLSHKGASSNYVESIKAPSILGGYWLGEFDNGRNSGWMYTVNAVHVDLGLKEQKLEDGDVVIWHYVDDYTTEEDEFTWLEAEDCDPEEFVEDNLEEILTIGKNGEVDPDEIKVSDLGKDITFKFEPDEGYVVKNLIIDGEDKGSVTSYTYEELSIYSRIEVEFAKAGELDFDDVKESDWFYEDVQYVVSTGLFNGTGDNKFSPNASMNRAMLVTVLYRLEGEPKVTGSSDFDDVARGQWYTDAVIWATKNEIVNGYGNGKFGPTDNITREQMATILYRYAEYKDYDTSDSTSLNGYSDFSSISAFALKSLKWANAEGLINGRTATTLAPKGTATRAEVAAILHRFVENVVND